MATPRKTIKIRDHDRTRRRLLEVVGEILREEGHSGLKTNNIARRLGKDKNLIRYYFQSLGNLEKAYIKENDYWFAFFETFSLSEHPEGEELMEFFIKLMQENFTFFRDNLEMQKIILWQISEANPLMRSVSDQRELEGHKLLSLTNSYFDKDDINFRALVAIILGASYYMVLHAETNKSTVCGLDINLEKDKQIILSTFERLIKMTWASRSSLKNHQKSNNMACNLDTLEKLVSQFTDSSKRAIDLKENELRIKEEVETLRNGMLTHLTTLETETQISNYLKINLYRIALICDELYVERTMDSNVANYVLNLLYQITKPLTEVIPGEFLLPAIFRKKEGLIISERWNKIENLLEREVSDSLLIELISIPIYRFNEAIVEMCWSDYKYVNYFLVLLENYLNSGVNKRNWFNFLISTGFNHSRFTSWCIDQIDNQVSGKDMSQSSSILNRLKDSLIVMHGDIKFSFEPRKPPITMELCKWIDEELNILEQINPSHVNSLKLKSKLKVIQLSYWEKLQYDHGFYEEINLDVFSEKIARSFSSKEQDALSPASIKSKFYPKDSEVLKPIENMLIKMLEDVRRFTG